MISIYVLCKTADWLDILEMIHDGTKEKQEPTGGTTAEEQLEPPHTTKGTTSRARQANRAQRQITWQP